MRFPAFDLSSPEKCTMLLGVIRFGGESDDGGGDGGDGRTPAFSELATMSRHRWIRDRAPAGFLAPSADTTPGVPPHPLTCFRSQGSPAPSSSAPHSPPTGERRLSRCATSCRDTATLRRPQLRERGGHTVAAAQPGHPAARRTSRSLTPPQAAPPAAALPARTDNGDTPFRSSTVGFAALTRSSRTGLSGDRSSPAPHGRRPRHERRSGAG